MIRSSLPAALAPSPGVAAGSTIARVAATMKTATKAPLTSHRVERLIEAPSLPSQQTPCAMAPGRAQAVGGEMTAAPHRRFRGEDALRVLSPRLAVPALLGWPRGAPFA